MISSLFLLIVLFGHPIFLNTFPYFVSFLFLDFHLLLILVCFVGFSIPSQCLFHFPLYCLSEVSLFGSTDILCFQHLTILPQELLPALMGLLLPLFNHRGEKFTFVHNR